MLPDFDTCALIFAGLGAWVFKDSRAATLVFANLAIHGTLTAVSASSIGAQYYILLMLVDLAFLLTCTYLNINFILSIIFFISIVYNGLSFIEFNSIYTLVYSSYSAVNKVLVSGLILTIYYSGFKNGRSNRNNEHNRRIDDLDNSGFQAGGSV